MMPAMRAAPSTSPFLASPSRTSLSVDLRHHDAALGDGHAFGRSFVRHVHHARFAAASKMSSDWRRDVIAATPRGRSRVRRARVAAATSAWRIRLSPTRKVEMPERSRRARSAG